MPAIVRRLVLFGAAALMLIATPSSALLVQPVFLDMRYNGVRSNAGLRVVNDRNRTVAVEVTVSAVSIPEVGPPVFTPIDGDDFLIFPAVANIPANGTQVFRVRWIGDPGAAEGKIFAFTTSELPVEIDSEGGAAVQLLYAIQTIVGIGPQGTRADIQTLGAERAESSEGVKGVRIRFDNSGPIHGQVTAATITVSSGTWSRRLEPAQVSEAVGLGLVPAGSQRSMFIPIPDLPSEGELTVDVDIPMPPLL